MQNQTVHIDSTLIKEYRREENKKTKAKREEDKRGKKRRRHRTKEKETDEIRTEVPEDNFLDNFNMVISEESEKEDNVLKEDKF